jgi:hypothetical protein
MLRQVCLAILICAGTLDGPPVRAQDRSVPGLPGWAPGKPFLAVHDRGPWSRRWMSGRPEHHMMLTLYRSPADAHHVAHLSRGLAEKPPDDDDTAFLRNFLPRLWRHVAGDVVSTMENPVAPGLCAVFSKHHRMSWLCQASRPDSAAVATVLMADRQQAARTAALLIAAYAAHHPMRLAGFASTSVSD